MLLVQPGPDAPIPEPSPDPAPQHRLPHAPNVPEPLPMPDEDDIPTVRGAG